MCMDEVAAPVWRPGDGRPPADRPRGSLPADRGGSGPHFSTPRLREPVRPDPDEPPSTLHRRAAVVAVGASAAALSGGGAYAVSQFFRDRPRTVRPEVGASAEGL